MNNKPKTNPLKNMKTMRTGKYEYLWIVQGRYGTGGWDDVHAGESWRDVRQTLKEYRENEPQYPHRVIRRRVLKGGSQ